MVTRPRLRVDRAGALPAGRRFDELLVERLDELSPSDRRQELLDARVRLRVLAADRHQKPLKRDLRVAGRGQPEGGVELAHPLRREWQGDPPEKLEALVSRPAREGDR